LKNGTQDGHQEKDPLLTSKLIVCPYLPLYFKTEELYDISIFSSPEHEVLSELL